MMQDSLSEDDCFDIRTAIAKNTKMYGRDQVVTEIQEVHARSCKEQGAPELLLVSGHSGTGKSTCAVRALQQKTNKIFMGKFDQSKTLRPFSAVMDALEQVCTYLAREVSNQEEKEDDDDKLRDLMQQYIAHDVSVLNETIPNFQETLGYHAPNDASIVSRTMVNSMYGFTRLQRALRSFLRFALCIESDLVLYIDDLQWADESSLELLSSFAQDATLKGLVIVGCFRDNEVDTQHALQKSINMLDEQVTVTQITLWDLSIEALNNFVADTLSLDSTDPACLELTKVVHRKTMGNIYFCIQFLELLHQNNLLYKSPYTLKWTWDLQHITEVNAQENVVEILANRIQALDDHERKVLTMGSCFGNRFNVQLLLRALEHYEGEQTGSAETIQMKSATSSDMSHVHRLVEDQFIDVVDAVVVSMNSSKTEQAQLPKLCKFSHDRVQQAAYASIGPPENTSSMHYQLGCFLLHLVESSKQQQKQEEDWIKIVAVDQLNKGLEHVRKNDKLRFKVAKMNLEAAHELKRKSAFLSATEFLAISLDLLGPEKWEWHYDVALAACTLSAQLEYSVGHFEACKSRVAEIQDCARKQQDKLDAEWTSIQCSIAETKYHEALSKGYNVVRSLGEAYPKQPGLLHVVLEYRKVRQLLKNRSHEAMVDLAKQPLKDPQRLLVLRYLTFLGQCAWYAGRDWDLALMTLRICKISFQEGFSQYTPFSLAAMCPVLLALSHDFEQATLLGNVALDLIDHFAVGDLEARTVVPILVFSHSFQRPYRNGIGLLEHGHRIGIAVGDMESSQVCQHILLTLSVLSGTQLHVDDERIRLATQEMLEYRQTLPIIQMKSLHQVVQNFMGLNDDPKVLCGSIVPDLDKMLTEGTSVAKERNKRFIVFLELYLAVFFDHDITEAKAKAKEHLSFKDKDFPVWYSFLPPFYRGLVWVSLVRKGKTKYRRHANRELQKLESWTRHGCINIHHMYCILKAEVASTKSANDNTTMHSLYGEAIHSARRCGIVQHQALACERAGKYFGSQHIADVDTSRFFLQEAMKLYGEWGCEVKANEIAQQHGLDAPEALAATPRRVGPLGGSQPRQNVADLYASRDFMTESHPFERQGVERSSVAKLKKRLRQSTRLFSNKSL